MFPKYTGLNFGTMPYPAPQRRPSEAILAQRYGTSVILARKPSLQEGAIRLADVPQYDVGETVQATLDFSDSGEVGRVTATFAHIDDPDTKFRLFGSPEQKTAEDGHIYWRVVLSGSVLSDDKPGVYSCESVEADYPGGRTVAFKNVPEAYFAITEEGIPPPEPIGNWEWGSGSSEEQA